MLTARRRWLCPIVSVALGLLAAGCGGSSAGDGARHADLKLLLSAPRLGYLPARSVARIAGGGFAGYGLLVDGRVLGWGDDLEGQIGIGGAWEPSTRPLLIPGLTNVVAISAGQNSAYALGRDGAVWAWGDDSQDELGDTGYAPKQTPRRVRVPRGVVAIAAGAFSAYALRRDGTVWAWGDGSVGQLGAVGTEDATGTPHPVPGLRRIIAIAAGAGTAYALARDGHVWAWGDGSLGQLGNAGCAGSHARAGSGCPRAGTPVKVRGLSRLTAIASGANTAYALRRDGTVWAWGEGSFGALGGARRPVFSARPTAVSGLSGVTAIAAGSYTGYAVLRDGSVRAWGRGVDGELGDGTTADHATPVAVHGLAGVLQVAGGGAMAYALDRRGRLWAWGSGLYGQLGNGHKLSLDEPTRVLKVAEPAAGA